jgi:hypothetical protein
MKTLKRLALIALMTVMTLTFTACKPAFEYDEDAAITRAKEVVDSINAGDYQAVYDIMDATMQAALPADKLQASFDPILKDSGAFVEYKGTSTTAVTQNGTDYIVAVITCKYEKATRVYTISLTRTDMKVGGLFMK